MLIRRLIFIMLFFILRPFTGLGNDGSMKGFRNLPGIHKMRAIADTIPEVKKPEEETPPSTTNPAKKIKEVPRSRRQAKPVPLPSVPVKPIKVIKPKIIKPIKGIIGH